MRRTPLALALFLVTSLGTLPAPARADDDPPVPAPAPEDAGTGAAATDDTAADAKMERRTSEAAEKAFERLGEALHLPMHSAKESISTKARAGLAAFGMPGAIDVRPTWTRAKGLDIQFAASDELKAALPPEQIEMATKIFGGWARDILSPVFESPNAYAKSYHCAHRRENERDIVEMQPFAEDAMVEQQTFYFDDNGLIERRVFIPKVDPTDPNMAMFAGAEIETTYGYEKRGDKSIIKQLSMLTAMGDIQGAYEYYDVEGRAPLLQKLTMITPFSVDPIVVTFEDYTIDGEKVGATTEKPVTGTADQDDDGASDADDDDGEGDDDDDGDDMDDDAPARASQLG